MTNYMLQGSEENRVLAKRKRVLAAVAQESVTSDDEDIVVDGMDICNIIENQTDQHSPTATSCALHALGETIRNTLLEINEIREQNRERRHRELLQILTKMVQQGNTAKNELGQMNKNLNAEIVNSEQSNAPSEYLIEQNFLENGNCYNDIEDAKNSCSKMFTKDCDITNNSASISENLSTKQFLANSKINDKRTNKITCDAAVKQNETKRELQKMRAKMLELQRLKMEDRERKKRNLLQTQHL